MKQKIQIIGLFIICGFAIRTNAQDNKYGLTLGGIYSDHMYGGNFKLDYLPNSRISYGIRGIVSTFSFSDYNQMVTELFKPGLSIMSDLTLTWHIIGNKPDSKKSLYAELGLGYLLQKVNYTAQYPNLSAFNVNENSNGLGTHVALGYGHKLGPGNINLELIVGTMLYGKFKHQEVYPGDYQFDSNGVGHPNTGGNYNKSGTNVGYAFLGVNVGYSIYF